MRPSWAAFEHAAVDRNDIGVRRRVEGEQAEGQGVVRLAHAQKTADRQYGVDGLAGALVDHEGVDRTDLFAVAAFDLHRVCFIRRDQQLGGVSVVLMGLSCPVRRRNNPRRAKVPSLR